MLAGDGYLREVIAYGRWFVTNGGRLREVVAYGSGHMREVVAYGGWSFTDDGGLRRAVAYKRRSPHLGRRHLIMARESQLTLKDYRR